MAVIAWIGSHLMFLVHTAAFRGALTGWASAAMVDLHASYTWHDYHDALSYDWRLAFRRWLIGALTGVLASFGITSTGM